MSASRSLSLPVPARLDLSARRILAWLALAALAVVCATGAWLVLAGSARMISSPNENTYPESLNVYAAIQGAGTGHIYLPLDSPPYALQQYGPLFYMVNFAAARASHLDLETTRLRLRWLSYLCYLLCGLLAALIVLRLGAAPYLAVFSALLLLGQHFFVEWNAAVRPDMLCLLLMLLCLYFAVGEDAPGPAACALSGFAGGLAFLVKQPSLAAPLAVLAVLLLRKSWRSAFVFAATAALPVALVFGLLLFRHESWIEQFTSLGKGYWSLRDGALFVAAKALDVRVLVPFGIGALGFGRALRGAKNSAVIAGFAAIGFAVALAGLPQLGADTNYYLPPLAACAMLLPFAVAEVRDFAAGSRAWVLVPVAVLLLWCAGSARAQERVLLFMHYPPAAGRYAPLAPFRILSDRPIFTVHGRDPGLLDPFTMHGLELAGHWSSAPVAESLRRGDYDLIILACEAMIYKVCSFRDVSYFSRPVVAAINENYVVLCSSFSERVLVPRARSLAVTPAMFDPIFNERCGTGAAGRPPAIGFPPAVR